VPTFIVGHYVFHVVENQPIGSHVGSVTAVDRDAPPRDQFVYVMTSLVHGFQVERESGSIMTTKSLDRERCDVYHLTVTARPTTRLNLTQVRQVS